MNIIVTRLSDNGTQTLGHLHVVQDFKVLFDCRTLELPWKNNERRASCIPTGVYPVRYRKDYESMLCDYDHLEVENVPDRSHILFHIGNFFTDILGCIITGTGRRAFQDINKDGQVDISSSRNTHTALMKVVSDVSRRKLKDSELKLRIMNTWDQ